MKIWIFLLFLFLIEGVGAEIIISELSDVYNVGDEINLSFSIQKQKNSGDYLECYLDCGDRLLVHKKYYLLEKDSKKNFEVSFPASLKGKCLVEVNFDGEKEESSDFEISNQIDADFSLNNKLFFPGEVVSINGTAIKKNGEKLNGFADIFVKGLENRTLEVKEGEFSLSFTVPRDALPREYEIEIEAFEKNAEEEITNIGAVTKSMEVKSKPSSISIVSKESIKPPFNFSAEIVLLDQAQRELGNESLIVKLFDSEGKLIAEEKGFESGEDFDYSFSSNSLRGMWKLYAYYGSIFSLKMINIEDNKQIDFNVVSKDEGSYMEITNIGNVEYIGNFQVSVANSSFKEDISINLSLGTGEKVLEPLNYEGIYSLSAGGKTIEVPITAAAVSPVVNITWKSYIAFFVIIIILIIAYFLIVKRKKFRIEKKEKHGKKAFMVFFKFDKYLDFEETVEKEGFSLSKVSDNLCYVLFYDDKRNPELSAYSLAKKIRNKSLSRMHNVSVVINSGIFYDKEKFLREFSLNSRKVLDYAEGGILVSEDILNKLNLKARKAITFKGKEKTFKMYRL